MECAVVERLNRSNNFQLHPYLVNAPLIYDERGKKALLKIYQEYVDIAADSEKNILLCTPTWRANYSRVQKSDVPPSVNVDAVTFLQEFKNSQKNTNIHIKIGGLIGCKNDCYKPIEALSISESQ